MLRDIRNNYALNKLDEGQLTGEPIVFFELWLNEAIQLKVNEPTAMVLATAVDNQPDTRVVLLKEIQHEDFVFYTNYISTKAREIESNKHVALNFFWAELERQVRVKGTISKSGDSLADEYFNSRPRESQLGAWASAQSQAIKSREELENKFEAVKKLYEGKAIPRPENWGGYKVKATEIEFWQGRPNRLHDRFRFYRNDENGWDLKRLSP
jgi:pyridoxamine 5'-phosphate oxidase